MILTIGKGLITFIFHDRYAKSLIAIILNAIAIAL